MIDEQSLQWALKEFFATSHADYGKQLETLKQAIARSPAGSFGYALQTYYLANPALPIPYSPDSLFPPNYLLLHDMTHVLLGADTQEAGEVYVSAFECGLMTGREARILTVLSQIQVLLEHRQIFLYDSAIAFKAFQIGAQADRALLDTLSPLDLTEEPLGALRRSLNIEPLSGVWG